MGSLILLDGAPDPAADWGGLLVAPSTEAVQEMQLIDNTERARQTRPWLFLRVVRKSLAPFVDFGPEPSRQLATAA